MKVSGRKMASPPLPLPTQSPSNPSQSPPSPAHAPAMKVSGRKIVPMTAHPLSHTQKTPSHPPPHTHITCVVKSHAHAPAMKVSGRKIVPMTASVMLACSLPMDMDVTTSPARRPTWSLRASRSALTPTACASAKGFGGGSVVQGWWREGTHVRVCLGAYVCVFGGGVSSTRNPEPCTTATPLSDTPSPDQPSLQGKSWSAH